MLGIWFSFCNTECITGNRKIVWLIWVGWEVLSVTVLCPSLTLSILCTNIFINFKRITSVKLHILPKNNVITMNYFMTIIWNLKQNGQYPGKT